VDYTANAQADSNILLDPAQTWQKNTDAVAKFLKMGFVAVDFRLFWPTTHWLLIRTSTPLEFTSSHELSYIQIW
jgi:hypothetical protein